MFAKAVFYRFFERPGGTVDIEDDDMGHCTIVTSDTASAVALRRRAAKKLRRMAYQLDAEAARKAPSSGSIQTIRAKA